MVFIEATFANGIAVSDLVKLSNLITKCGGVGVVKDPAKSAESPATPSNSASQPLLCPWAEGNECENVNIKCGMCCREPLLLERKDYAVVAQQQA